jgi:hypothetical protein
MDTLVHHGVLLHVAWYQEFARVMYSATGLISQKYQSSNLFNAKLLIYEAGIAPNIRDLTTCPFHNNKYAWAYALPNLEAHPAEDRLTTRARSVSSQQRRSHTGADHAMANKVTARGMKTSAVPIEKGSSKPWIPHSIPSLQLQPRQPFSQTQTA